MTVSKKVFLVSDVADGRKPRCAYYPVQKTDFPPSDAMTARGPYAKNALDLQLYAVTAMCKKPKKLRLHTFKYFIKLTMVFTRTCFVYMKKTTVYLFEF